MSRLLPSRRARLAVFLCAALGAGCGPSVSVVPVSGKVTLDGQPVTSGQVSYVPLDEKAAAAGMSAGSINANGEYKIFTAGKEGAPLGKYKVTVTPSMVPTGDPKAPTTPYSRKYTTFQETPLEKEVVNGPAPGAYDLPLTK